MKIFKLSKYITIITSFLIFVTFLDIIIAKSLYHPLIYPYKFLSWLITTNSTSAQTTNNPASKMTVSTKNRMVVTTQHEATKVGIQILNQGGNAIDAAVAIGYALAVTDPCCGNLGGGGFMLIRLANGKEIFINFREKAPLAATPNMYLDKQGKVITDRSRKGYLAVGVPGTVKGLDYALNQYGTLSREQVISPSIQLAEKGFILTEGDIRILKLNEKKFTQSNVAAIFLKNGKTTYQVGDRLIQKDLAKTLKLISQNGSDVFYNGEIAQKVVQASQENQGILSLKDFQQYSITEQEPLRCNYRGYKVISSPPPGGGTTLCQMLNILEGYNLKKLGFHTPQNLHLMLSAMLYAYAYRNIYLGDPKFVNIPLDILLSKEYAEQIRTKILPNKARNPEELYQPILQPEGTNTTHYSVVDKDGNAVAVTYTINSNFGAAVIASDTGFLLNNEMDDFTSKPGEANQFSLIQGNPNLIEPQKQPLSSMSPTILTKNGQLFLVTGSPGGSTIPTTILQVITNLVDHQMNLEQAVNSSRIHYQGLPNAVLNEPNGLNDTTIQKLSEMGYKINPFYNWGAAESILIDPEKDLIYGVNDQRKPAGQALD
ncbi:gamma-glutamyltransferase [Aphanothece hegewaldii CCALA 016]|uniref:Glutathione hydrolase proenzyme n=1 Tax=Aphanothece hegewaldii CCALA 016 TaxID=2107694 RepID=A0A2T1M0Z2_9CHRO|nr:gamma-glutamyltransferase [Aphanothece hegewaldii]PSF38373.1 gamma-glutamyltransferase [Aphanothece hegewaldii CCALA 016]